MNVNLSDEPIYIKVIATALSRRCCIGLVLSRPKQPLSFQHRVSRGCSWVGMSINCWNRTQTIRGLMSDNVDPDTSLEADDGALGLREVSASGIQSSGSVRVNGQILGTCRQWNMLLCHHSPAYENWSV